MTNSLYLKLLWIYVALAVATIASGFFSTYSEALTVAYDAEPSTWLMSNPWVAGGFIGSLVAAWLIGLVGLFRFKSWARSLSLYSTLAGFLVGPFLGTSLSSGLESTLAEASSIVWGAILALSYFSTVSGRFGR
jgi:hypothetical protein